MVVITNEHNLITTASAQLVGSNVSPSILSQPRGVTAEAGKDVEFAVETVGAKSMSYQWFFNEKPIDGGKSAALTLVDVTMEMVGNYHSVVFLLFLFHLLSSHILFLGKISRLSEL